VLGVGGAFADHSFDVQPVAAPSATTVPIGTAGHAGPQSLAQFVGLTSLGAKPAPPINLESSEGRPFSLSELVGHPVILTFLAARCGGICPIVISELRLAEGDLARSGLHPQIVIVNVDPRAARPGGAGNLVASAMLGGLGRATLLDGSLAQLDAVWRSFKVTIELAPANGALAYTQVIDLIDGHGRLRDSLTPFADESFSGRDSLPAAQLDRFASGIATYLRRIAR
jgi:cytochrome oxidase Cu insertion factor (SCO1/SenC/PrrC family)